MDKENVISLFKDYYKVDGNIYTFFSPGRVNLIGEHIDYNGGFVFPAALSLGIYAAVSKREDSIIKLKSNDIEGEVIINLKDEIKYNEEDGWGNYPKGVIKDILNRGNKVKGYNIYFASDLPNRAGLSSSASLEVLTGFIVISMEGKEVNRIELAKLCQDVENKFIKVNCGIMDQFSVSMGKENMAILLDCNTLKYEYTPVKLNDFSLVIMNTNKKRGLADSKYNERREECQRALDIIKNSKYIDNLCDANIENIDLIDNLVIRKRAKHVICENERVKKAVKVLKEGNIIQFGELLIKSHNSLKEDYEVTGFELDSIVNAALHTKGCIGSRMTGAGFGGCAIAIVDNKYIEEFKLNVFKIYKQKTGLNSEFYVSVIGDGVKAI